MGEAKQAAAMGEAKQAAARQNRLNHVVAHESGRIGGQGQPLYDEVIVFGTELLALRHIVGKADWVYQALQHGQTLSNGGPTRTSDKVDGL